MKSIVCITITLLLYPAAALPQEASTESSLRSMVAAERAFAKASEEKGTREAFLMFIADDGILFRPTAVVGKKWFQEHPVPASAKRPLLSWQPVFADIAAAGDMGYTFGPWEFKQDIHDQKAVAFGHFATIWKRQADGSWKFAVDLGISHPVSAIPTTPWAPKATARKSAKHRIAPAALNLARAGLRARDLEFSQTSAREGSLKAFTAYTADDIRIFRNEHLPFAGKSALEVALSSVKGVLTWQPEGVDVSRSGDLGYTYGRYEIKENGALTGKGNYMRFWKKQNDAWKVVLDVADPLPLEEKKG